LSQLLKATITHRAFTDAVVLTNQGVLAGVFAIRQNLA